MSETDLTRQLAEALASQELEPAEIEALASQLVWRVGRVSDDGPVTVRVGFATSAPLFAELPRLRGASDSEIEAAIGDGSLRVEWVGQRL